MTATLFAFVSAPTVAQLFVLLVLAGMIIGFLLTAVVAVVWIRPTLKSISSAGQDPRSADEKKDNDESVS